MDVFLLYRHNVMLSCSQEKSDSWIFLQNINYNVLLVCLSGRHNLILFLNIMFAGKESQLGFFFGISLFQNLAEDVNPRAQVSECSRPQFRGQTMIILSPLLSHPFSLSFCKFRCFSSLLKKQLYKTKCNIVKKGDFDQFGVSPAAVLLQTNVGRRVGWPRQVIPPSPDSLPGMAAGACQTPR